MAPAQNQPPPEVHRFIETEIYASGKREFIIWPTHSIYYLDFIEMIFHIFVCFLFWHRKCFDYLRMFPNDPFQFIRAHIDLKWGWRDTLYDELELDFQYIWDKGPFHTHFKINVIFCFHYFGFCAKAKILDFSWTNFIPQINCFRSFLIIEYPKDEKNEMK